ncbi:MAG: histidine--tRNA ligase [Firmicutes bacterium]|nr:histidine--tRNA ligase [Alicyclobacillaceae bacterium]MCL6496618.1 histidine--tRNA ligase [Bacillota bacterium]
MRTELQRPRGTQDVLPPESWKVEGLRQVALTVARRYGFEPVETPIFEQSAVFLRVGEHTDIVQHERYTFRDAGGVELTLRPEGTAAVARAYVENGLQAWPKPVRLCYFGPMFRRERPQAGRFRQHTQFGAELYGSESPLADAEVILLALAVVEAAGLADPEVRVNSIGCERCRPRYREALVGYFAARREALCPDCQVRLERNPLRLLDCKVDVAVRAEAPDLADYWCDDCRAHFAAVEAAVASAGRRVERDPHLVRGLDYYTRTVFEVGHPSLGAGVALFGGGRYDGLVASLDGPTVPAVGFGMGIERLLGALGDRLAVTAPTPLYVGHLPGYAEEAFRLAEWLRNQGVAAESDLLGRSVRAQLKDAARRTRWAVLVGGREWEAGQVVVRDLGQGTQAPWPKERLLEWEGVAAARLAVGVPWAEPKAAPDLR